jgi:hypothetical protein
VSEIPTGVNLEYYTPTGTKKPHTIAVSRFRVSKDDPNKADPDSEERLLEVEHHRVRRGRLYLRHRLDPEIGSLLEGLRPLHGLLHGRRVERGAIAELDPVAELERIGLAVLGYGPGSGQDGAQRREVVVDIEQGLIEVVAGPPESVEGAGMRVVGAELRVLADIQDVF